MDETNEAPDYSPLYEIPPERIRVQHERLRAYLAEAEITHGPIPQEYIDEVRTLFDKMAAE
jgi:hypothetical protein